MLPRCCGADSNDAVFTAAPCCDTLDGRMMVRCPGHRLLSPVYRLPMDPSQTKSNLNES